MPHPQPTPSGYDHELYRLALRCVTDHAVLFLDDAGRVVCCNAGTAGIFGFREADGLGKHLSSVYTSAVTQADVDSELQSAVANGRSQKECWLERQDGTRLWIHTVTTCLRDEQGQVRGFVVTVHDGTAQREVEQARRRSEGRFRALFENAWDGVTLLAADGSIVEATPVTFRGLGYSPEEYLGRNGFEFLHPDDVAVLRTALAQVLERPGQQITVTYRLRHHDGSWRWVEALGTNLLDEPYIQAIVVNHRDITERKMVEARLREADRRKDIFLATLAHELRNPMAPLWNGLQLLKLMPADPAATEETREMMGRQLEHLARLVDDLLDVSRITGGKINLRLETVELAEVISRAVETARPLIEARKHQFQVSLPTEPILLEGDLTRLSQVIANLLHNAAKYTDEGGRISLTAERAGYGVSIRVRDSGTGISAEILPRIFDLFTQAERSLDRSQGGLGIGLTLVRGLAEMHGGIVQAHSDGVGHGSEFVVHLPVLPAPLPQAPAPSEEDGAARDGAVRRRRVLVVDTHRDSADSVGFLLRLWGHDVWIAYDAARALDLAREHRPEVVLLEQGGPQLPGADITQLIRAELEPAGGVIVGLGGHGREAGHNAGESGFDALLVKPIDPLRLKAILLGKSGTSFAPSSGQVT